MAAAFAYSYNLDVATRFIRLRRGLSSKLDLGAVLLKARVYPLDKKELLRGTNIYQARNPTHFWIDDDYHITIQDGFDLSNYCDFGEKAWEKDVGGIIKALNEDDYGCDWDETFEARLYSSTIMGEASFLPGEAIAAGEDKYYTVVLKFQPTAEMRTLRNALCQCFPHTQQEEVWSPHVSIATFSDESDRDLVIHRLKDNYIKITGLRILYNMRKN